MTKTKIISILVAVAVVSAVAGYYTALYLRGMHGGSMSMGHGSMMKMDHGAMVKTEQDFLTGMIPHHQEAIETAQDLFTVTTDPTLRAFLANVIRAQSAEVKEMETWYQGWYMQEYVDSGTYTPMMRSVARSTPVAEYEKIWLTDMIGHHQGAVQMAQAVLRIQGIHPETKTLAERIIATQTAEIEQMKEMLKTR